MKIGRSKLYNRRLDRALVLGLEFLVRFNVYVTYLTLLHLAQALPAASSRSVPESNGSPLHLLFMADNAAAAQLGQNNQGHQAQAPVPPKDDPENLLKLFSHIRFQKHDDFPSLLHEVKGIMVKIPPSDLLPWQNSADGWFAAHGAPGIFELTNVLILLSEDGSEISSMAPALPGLEDSNSLDWQRALLEVIADTVFGRHICLPTGDRIRAMEEPCIKALIKGVRQLSAELSYKLKRATTPPGKFVSAIPDIIDSQTRLSKNHLLDGFIQLQQILKRMGKEPQGSALQLKERLIQGLRDKLHQPGTAVSLWDITHIMDDVNNQILNVTQRQAQLREATEMEAVQATANLILHVSRAHMEDKAATPEVKLGAAKINHTTLAKCGEFAAMPWFDFHIFAANLFAQHLPATPPSKESAGASSKNATSLVAMLAEAGLRAVPMGATPADWVCENCGGPGHRKHECKNPPNPDAPRLVAQAKDARYKKRKDRMEKETKRKKITKQQQQLSAATSPAAGESKNNNNNHTTTNNKSKDANQQADRVPVNVGLSVTAIDDGDRITRYSYNCHTAVAATKADPTFPVVSLILAIVGCALGTLVCAMTIGLGNSPLHATTVLVSLSLSIAAFMQPTVRAPPTGRHIEHYALLWLLVVGPLICFISGAAAYTANPLALPAMSPQTIPNCDNTIWVDSGCSKTVIRNAKKLCNLRPPDRPYFIKGIGGDIEVTHMGDLSLTLQDKEGVDHTRVVRDCLVAPLAPANLLSTRDLQAAGIGFEVPPTPDAAASINITTPAGLKVDFALQEHQGLYMVPFRSDIMTIFAGVASHQLRSLTTFELWHLRLCHAGASKIAKLSANCIGIAKKLAKQRHPCHVCQEAKATKQPYPEHADHSNDDDILCFDQVFMGKTQPSKAGHRYMTIFVVARTRYVMVFFHKTREETATIIKRAFTRLGRYPRILRCDGAWEYDTQAIDAICLEHNIQLQHSNPHQQFGNALSEIMVNTIGNGIRVSLHDANLPPEFWTYAAINCVDVYNHLPHSALQDKTPWECEKGTTPDVSWFRPFGCRATVYIGDHKQQLIHRKLTARGEPCIYLGLGFYHGMKGWICWNPENDKTYCTRNVVFDETFMPLRPFDQRILGHYDSAPRTRMARAVYDNDAAAEDNAAAIDNLPTSRIMEHFRPVPDDEADELSRAPAGRDSHDEADGIITDLDDQDT